MARGNTGKLNKELEKALAEELKEVTRKHPKGHEEEGRFVYSTVERCRVIDRCLKMQSIQLKADNPEFGAEFGKGSDA